MTAQGPQLWKEDPVNNRVLDLFPRAGSGPTNGRLSQLVHFLAPSGAKEAYVEWRSNPLTTLFINALRELSYLPYAKGVLPTDGDLQIQYGMTLAFQYAVRLLGDPESVLDVFRPAGHTGGHTEEDTYSIPPDEV